MSQTLIISFVLSTCTRALNHVLIYIFIRFFFFFVLFCYQHRKETIRYKNVSLLIIISFKDITCVCMCAQAYNRRVHFKFSYSSRNKNKITTKRLNKFDLINNVRISSLLLYRVKKECSFLFFFFRSLYNFICHVVIWFFSVSFLTYYVILQRQIKQRMIIIC